MVLEGEWLKLISESIRSSFFFTSVEIFILPTFGMQKSGEFVVLVGLNAENEILHTLAFLAGVMIWSQVCSISVI